MQDKSPYNQENKVNNNITEINIDATIADAFSPFPLGKEKTKNSSFVSLSSHNTPVDNSSATCELSPDVTTLVKLPNHDNDNQDQSSSSPSSSPSPSPSISVITPTENYIQTLIREIKSLFDLAGLPNSIVSNRNDITTFKNGVATIDLPWFNFMRDCALKSLTNTEEIINSAPNQENLVAEEDKGINLQIARKLFAEYFAKTFYEILQMFYYRMTSSGRRISSDLQELLSHISERLLQNTLKNLENSKLKVAPTSMQEIKDTILHDFENWILLLFPYFKFVTTSRRQMQLIWLNDSVLNKEDFAFQIYSFATGVSLLDKDNEVARGVLFPVKWLNELLDWLSGDNNNNNNNNNNNKAVPGPFDTFHLVELSKEEPVKHLLMEENEEADVIPEEMFNFLWSMFGGGPKYLVRGTFRSRELIVKRLKPRRCYVKVVFDGINSEVLCLAAVLHRAEILEVLRRALSELRRYKRCREIELKMWCAALCTNDGVKACVTHLKDKLLDKPYLISHLKTVTLGNIIEEIELNTMSENNSKVSEIQFLVRLRQPIDRFTLGSCGVCGLLNIGNTCYMNSALQCLSNMTNMRRTLFSLPISEYANPTITKELLNLFISMWSGTLRTANTHRLKTEIGRVERRFDSHEQQDAMEFIEVLLDRVHEEINTVSSKCYRERLESDKSIPTRELSSIFWKDFLNNNRSFIPKLFFHQSKTRLECLTCGEMTIAFDNNPTLVANVVSPVKKRNFEVIILLPSFHRIRMHVKVPYGKDNNVISVEDVIQEIRAQLLPLKDETSSGTQSSFSNNTNNNNNNNNNNNSDSSDDVFEIAKKYLQDDYRLILHADPIKFIPSDIRTIHGAFVPVSTKTKKEQNGTLEITIPIITEGDNNNNNNNNSNNDNNDRQIYVWYFIKAKEKDYWTRSKLCYVERLPIKVLPGYSNNMNRIVERSKELYKLFLENKKIDKEVKNTLFDTIEGDQDNVDVNRFFRVFYQPRNDDRAYQINANGFLDEQINNFSYYNSESEILLEYDSDVIDLNDKLRELNHPSYNISTHFHNRNFFNSNFDFDDSVTMEECLKSTFSSDTLTNSNAPYCSRCKELRDGKMERSLFLLPPCLIISLKRFKARMHETSKNHTIVTVSDALDLAPFIDPQSPEQNTRYKLRGIVSHQGKLNFGHYTASAHNDNAKQWIHYDDTQATPLTRRPSERDAYIVCYERDEGDSCESKNVISELNSSL